MQHEQAKELFSDYIAGELDKALTLSLENHLEACDTCRTELAGMRTLWTALEQQPLAETPLYYHENLMSRLDAVMLEEEQKAERSHALWDWRQLFRARPRVLAYGASLLLLGLISMEAVQTQRAELGPLSALIHMFRPAKPQVQGIYHNTPQGPTLSLKIPAQPKLGRCQVSVTGMDGAPKSILLDQDQLIDIPMIESKAPSEVTLTLTPEGTGQNPVTLRVSVNSRP